MNASSNRDPEVLIVGAGPTGLALALWLTRLGVRVRIVDKTAEPGTTSRAVGVQARTLEFYSQLGLADEIVACGRKAPAANLWVTGKKAARFFFGDMGADISPFPYALVFPQDEHERLLIDHLARLGVQVGRRTELLGFAEADGRVQAQLKLPDGTTETCAAAYLAGCDGAHSAVREALAIGFAGGTYHHRCYVADVQASGPAMNGELHVAVDRSDFLAIFPLKGDGRARLIGSVRNDVEQLPENLAWQDVNRRVIEGINLNVERVNWFSTYRVHHRVADHFRQGRAFLLGDAAHIHSPVGGQGLNAGIGDAVNLAWKLAAVLRGRADASLLDTYEPERIAFARRLVATTDRIFAGVTSSKAFDRLVRLNIVPSLMPLLFKFALGAAFSVPRDFPGGSQLPREPLERWTRRRSSWRRPAALDEDRLERVHGQLCAADFVGLAGSRLWHRHARNPSHVCGEKIAPACFPLAPEDDSNQPAARRRLSPAAGRLRGPRQSGGQHGRGYVLSRRAQARSADAAPVKQAGQSQLALKN